MIITGATGEQIEEALKAANIDFNGNLKFKRFTRVKTRRDGRPVYNVTLKVEDSHNKGSKRSPSGRRIAAACWHAYGTFIDYLPEGTEVDTSTGSGSRRVHPGDEWHDWYIGAGGRSVKASKLCEC